MTTNPVCHITASQIMTSPVQVVYDTWSIKQLMDFFIQQGISGAPVISQEGALVGVVSAKDTLRFENLSSLEKEVFVKAVIDSQYMGYEWPAEDIHRLAEHADFNCPVSQIMTPKIISVDPQTKVPEIAHLFKNNHIHRVFVLENKKVVGVISTSHLLDLLIEACHCE